MKQGHLFSVGGVAALCGLLAGGAASAAPVTQGLVLSGVTIVDTQDGKLSRDMAVVIDGGKIVQIARAKSVTVAGSARLVDARGKYVVPGYLDMHVHALVSSDPKGS